MKDHSKGLSRANKKMWTNSVRVNGSKPTSLTFNIYTNVRFLTSWLNTAGISINVWSVHDEFWNHKESIAQKLEICVSKKMNSQKMRLRSLGIRAVQELLMTYLCLNCTPELPFLHDVCCNRTEHDLNPRDS